MIYSISDNAVEIKKSKNHYNRPLYFRGLQGYVLAGERMALKCVQNQKYLGRIIFGLEHDNGIVWLDQIESNAIIKPGNIKWEFGEDCHEIISNAVSKADGGLAFKLTSKENIKLVCFIGALEYAGPDPDSPQWGLDPMYHSTNRINTIYENETLNDNYTYNERALIVNNNNNKVACASYLFSHIYKTGISKYLGVNVQTLIFNIKKGEHFYLDGNFLHDQFIDDKTDIKFLFEKAVACAQQKNIYIRTPDATLDTAACFADNAYNATFIDNVYNHGAMAWSIPFPGWESIYGAIVTGQISNIIKEARNYIDTQTITDEKHFALSTDKFHLRTIQHPDSVFHGLGRIQKDQNMYNFQSIFFDQLINAYKRYESDELLELLLKALPVHSIWQDRCFDPQQSGLYESYINTWPTDTVWNNGGKACEETSFAYNVSCALAYVYKTRHDQEKVDYYIKKADAIKTAFRNELWIKNKGHAAFYKDIIGEKMLHEDAWLYSILYPISSDLINEFEKVESLYYTEYGLERVQTELGGQRTYFSNFAPNSWSVRELNYSEDFQLAKAYFKSGLLEQGYYLFKSAYEDSCLTNYVPMCFGTQNTATDFTDILSTFLNTLSEGLFGINYNSLGSDLCICPAFPIDWEFADFKTNDISYEYKRDKNHCCITIELDKYKNISLKIPLYGQKAGKALLNGQECEYLEQPGFMNSFIVINAGNTKNANIDLYLSGDMKIVREVNIAARNGDSFSMEGYENIIDNQCVIDKNYKITGDIGNHTIFGLKTDINKNKYYDVIHIDIEQSKDNNLNYKIPENTRFEKISLNSKFNSDIRNIYKNKYLSPRLETCSLQMGVDGFTSWTFSFWGAKPPEMDLSSIKELKINEDTIIIPQGIPFYLDDNGNNIIAISKYDNFNSSESVPIGKSCSGVWILFSGMTNHMQTLVSSGIIKINYDNKTSEIVNITNPINFINVCDFKRPNSPDGRYDNLNHRFVYRNGKPETIMLGANVRACLIGIKTDKSKIIKEIEFTAKANETVLGILAITLNI